MKKARLLKKRKRGTRSNAQRKAQAAIFDGITFLLMTGFSCALVYSAITGYGESLDNALYAFYELNYLQSAVKSLYYLSLNQLATVGDEGILAYGVAPGLSNADLGCSRFGGEYASSLTVVDLLKKDLSDNPANPAPQNPNDYPVLDDRFWSTPSQSGSTAGVSAPGRQALRCALKELMKPLVLAGYDYYAEVICPNCQPLYKAIEVEGARVSSNEALSKSLAEIGDGGGCLYAQLPQGGSNKVLGMDVPLRISLGTSCIEAQQGRGGCQRNYILRVCVWQKT